MSQLHIPTIKFVLPSVANEAGVLTYFLTPDAASNNWRKVIFNRHPELEEIVNGCIDKNEINRRCVIYVRKYRKENKADFQRSLKENERLWRPVEKKYLRLLSEHFEIPYPKNKKVVTVYVSIVPIYPRYLSDWSFNVSFFDPGRVKEIACHEIQHFLYFQKWLEVFPKTKLEELNHPHLVWRLSELIDPVILNEHPEFKKLFTREQKTYKHFQAIRIRGKQPTMHLAVIYRRHLRSGKNFGDFLKEIWNFANENKEALMRA